MLHNFLPTWKTCIVSNCWTQLSEKQNIRRKNYCLRALKCHPWEWKSAPPLSQNSFAKFGKYSSHMRALLVSSCLGLGTCTWIGRTCWVPPAAAEINYSCALNAKMSFKKRRQRRWRKNLLHVGLETPGWVTFPTSREFLTWPFQAPVPLV